MNTTAFHSKGSTLTTPLGGAIQPLLTGKDLAGWHIECRESATLRFAHGLLVTHRSQAVITLAAELSEDAKLRGLRFLLRRLAEIPLHTTAKMVWQLGDNDDVEGFTYDPVLVYDTTLCDCADIPGLALGIREKVELAQQLALLRVDILEAGYPARSAADAAAVGEIALRAGQPNGPVIAARTRADRASIDIAWQALQPAARRRLNVCVSTADRQPGSEAALRESVLRNVGQAVAYARSLCDDIQLTALDASSSDPQVLREVLSVALEAGATTLTLADSEGRGTPNEYGALIAGILRHVAGADGATLSARCHNDMGMAVGNTLMGVQAGARQVECSVNGVGKQAGIAPLEEVVMALYLRSDFYAVTSNIHLRELAHASRLVRDLTQSPFPRHKPIVGDGIVTVAKEHPTIAQLVGLDGPKPVLGSESTYRMFRLRLAELGYELDLPQTTQLYGRFWELAARKKVISDREIADLLHALFHETKQQGSAFAAFWTLDALEVRCGLDVDPSAEVGLRDRDGLLHTAKASGTGPIDAVFQAINTLVLQPNQLFQFRVKAITEGIDAVAEVRVLVRVGGPLPQDEAAEEDQVASYEQGIGLHTDTVVAAALAYLHAMNKILNAAA